MMLVGTLVSCATSGDDPTVDGAGTQASTQEEDTREKLEIPDTRYDGKELCFLVREEGLWSTVEIFTESKNVNADNISYAVFERNDRILQKYGVTITQSTTGSLTNEVAAPTGDFLAVVTNVHSAASNATSGFLWNLRSDSIQYIDTTKPWWDNKMAEGLSIDDRLYFATGDIMTLDNDATFAVMFNKLLAKNCQLPNLYELVDNGQWTMDKLHEFSQMAVQDLDGTVGLSYDQDVSGFAYTMDGPACMLIGGGVTLTKKDENDMPYYDLNLELAQNISDKCKLLFSKDYTVNLSAASVGVEEAGKKCFGENHSLFFAECLQCVTRVRGYDVDFGILPFPKFDLNQKDYFSLMHFTASVVSIPKSVTGENLTMTESMIEAMAYHAVDTLTKQYYEINLKTKGAKDAESGPMIDTILANRACDFAYYYGWGGLSDVAECLLPSTTASVASASTRASKYIRNSMNKFIRKMATLD
jgi:hypothetical protein